MEGNVLDQENITAVQIGLEHGLHDGNSQGHGPELRHHLVITVGGTITLVIVGLAASCILSLSCFIHLLSVIEGDYAKGRDMLYREHGCNKAHQDGRTFDSCAL